MRTILVIPQIGFTKNQQAVIRSAEAFGISEVCIIGKDEYKFSARVTRGGHKHIKIRRFPDVDTCLNYLAGERIKIISIENDDDAVSLCGYKFPANVAFVVGHERNGVPKEFLDNSIHVRIPQYGLMKCLNTSVASSIVLYERFKQRLRI